jgi:hypothetical protein
MPPYRHFLFAIRVSRLGEQRKQRHIAGGGRSAQSQGAMDHATVWPVASVDTMVVPSTEMLCERG